MTTAIRVHALSKRYRLGLAGPRNKYRTLREALTEAMTFRRKTQPRNGRAERIEDFWALNDVDFSVNRAEVVGIVGRNGSGKSTLLKILSKITKPSTGRVEIRGRVASLLEVGTGFHPELTGRENIFLSGSLLGMSRREIVKKYDEIVDFAEIAQFLDTPVKRYSSGMYVRLAFAVAAHLEPEILLVDEVLAVGDAAFQAKCLGVMSQVSNRGRTVLFVSHNTGAILQLTKRCILLEKGRIRQDGPTREVMEEYHRAALGALKTRYVVDRNPRHNTQLRREVEFLEVSLDNNESCVLSFDDSIRVGIKVRANVAVEQFRFSLTLFRFDGTPVGTLFGTSLQGLAVGEEAGYEMHLSHLRLAPGFYYIGMSTGKGNHLEGNLTYDEVLDVLHFEMLPPTAANGTRATWSAGWGSLHFESPAIARTF